MNRHPIWPYSSFWFRQQYADPEFDPMDGPHVPRELNYLERFWVRFVFAEAKLLVAVVLGLLVALWYVAFITNVWAWIATMIATVVAGVWSDISLDRRDRERLRRLHEG